MALPNSPEKVTLFIGVMSKNPAEVLDKLTTLFGPVKSDTSVFDFDYTSYYDQEFGSGMKKQFFAFGRIDPSELPSIKLACNELEGDHRSVNIDPGYVSKHALVIASCKPRPYRVYLRDGVYAHLNYLFRRNALIKFSWSLPDYVEHEQFFRKLR